MESYSGRVPEHDLVHMFVPLMRQIAALHAEGCVAAISPETVIEKTDGTFGLADEAGEAISTNLKTLSEVQPLHSSSLNILGDLEVTKDNTKGVSVRDRQVAQDDETIARPVFVSGYRCWENLLGHHDERTDIFCVGQLMAALACDLDFESAGDVEIFAANRTNLFRLNGGLHPVIASLIENMTELNRHDRLADMEAIARRLENYREELASFDPERVLADVSSVPDRRTAVLSHLRDRLFDLSRRNKLIHFRPTQASVNLTVASVPLVMRLESIRKDQLCTWGNRFAKDVLSTKAQPLGRWLRFEDQPYLPSALDRIIQQARRDRNEYGFSNLRLVVAYLSWYNLKDAPNEKINSPLLWLPVDVKKKKGVRDRYQMQASDNIAEFNPALRHYLKQLYDIDLPDSVDLTETSIAEIHAQLKAQIHQTEPGVSLELTTQPSIRLIHEKAVQRLRQYQKRRGKAARKVGGRPDFSYDRSDYKPLGRTLFEKHVVIKPLPQRDTLGIVSPPPRPDYMADGAVKETEKYSLEKEDKGKFAWEIDCAQVTLAHFNYRKMSLVRDYSALIDQAEEQRSFDRLFSITPREIDAELPESLPADEQWSVVASDATQDAAVAMARKGDSFIIQGPPGTGKSQTITNLIADFAANGKRVLFVCEKRAALDVVFNRLKQAGLERLSCLIHDSQEDKKSFIHDLKDCYEDWVKNESGLEEITATRARTVKALTHNFAQIEEFEEALSAVDAEDALSIRALVRRQLELPAPDGEYGHSALASINPNVRNIFAAEPPADPLRSDILAHLVERGHAVEEYVGGASFRCDLAIKSKDATDYDLAILIDGGTRGAAQRTYERYVFKPGILRAFGWRVIDIPSHSWFQDKDAVLAMIEAELRQRDDIHEDDDPFAEIPLPAQVSVPSTKPKEPEHADVSPPTGEDWQTFHFKRGNSDKFWRTALRGTDVIVNYGRTGTKGQSVTKSYDDEERAKRDMNKLILEKTRKGYVEQ